MLRFCFRKNIYTADLVAVDVKHCCTCSAGRRGGAATTAYHIGATFSATALECLQSVSPVVVPTARQTSALVGTGATYALGMMLWTSCDYHTMGPGSQGPIVPPRHEGVCIHLVSPNPRFPRYGFVSGVQLAAAGAAPAGTRYLGGRGAGTRAWVTLSTWSVWGRTTLRAACACPG
jgi:hypothetical protein